MTKIPTMTLNELVGRMRDLGVPKGQETLAAEIEAGMYPFAQCVRLPGSCKRPYTIYTVLFERWVRERAEEVLA